MPNPVETIDESIKAVKLLNDTSKSITHYVSDMNIKKTTTKVAKTKTKSSTVQNQQAVPTKYIDDTSKLIGVVVFCMLLLFAFCLLWMRLKRLTADIITSGKTETDAKHDLLEQQHLNVKQRDANTELSRLVEEQRESGARIERTHLKIVQDFQIENARLHDVLKQRTESAHKTTCELITATEKLVAATHDISRLHGEIENYEETIASLNTSLEAWKTKAHDLEKELATMSGDD